ncbi:conjugal transfer protein TrbE [Sphingomonas crusticola]|uniref:conjugal transfer protein TrbE n=1 Tax=Sphingomonas crusticola TaxID=1697973 RepID=UPI000E257D1F|nr:conjugal transfer protein TrbE [Sphingomonas crusticola]
MLKLAEYRQRADRLADHLPWAAMVAPGVILNKDGSFQRSFAYRGPDLESASDVELIAVCARVNNALKRFGSGWAFFFEASRVEAQAYPASDFPEPASWLVDEERRAAFEAAGAHFESRYIATLLWLPPADAEDAAGRSLVQRPDGAKARDWRAELARFVAESLRLFDLLDHVLAEIRLMSADETLTYLHGAISTRRHAVRLPETPFYLDVLLADTPLTGGLAPRLGDMHLATLTITGFPNLSRPGLLDALNHLGFEYRWMTRFLALDKKAASRALTRIRRQWFNKRKSVTALLREVMYNQPAQLLDSDADNKVVDADLALQELGGDHVAFGYLTTTITLADRSGEALAAKLREVERIVNGLGFVAMRESVNAVEAWLSSLPGHVYANVRQPPVHTLNLAHLMPLSAAWAGPASDRHLAAPPLLYAQTDGVTPFRLAVHVGDVGHMLVVGPTGAGKSVLLALMALQFRRYAGGQVILFDKGRSARGAVLAGGGLHHMLGVAADDQGLAFQPLRDIGGDAERAWAAEWIGALIEQQGVPLTPDHKDALWTALTSLASAPMHERTLTGLSMVLQSNALRAALQPFTLEGPYGALLDAADESLRGADLQCFEMEALMATPGLVAPVLSFLFHRLEARFDGRPTLLMLDEAWLFLDHPLFAGRIREWLKTLRKRNVAVVFATQSLADIAASSIAPAIIESCPQRIFLPNDRASEPQSQAAYQRFGLNERQLTLIARATPKRHYYLQSARGNRLFELGLGPVGLALCGSSGADSQRHIDAALEAGGRTGFLAAFLTAAGLGWAARMAADFSSPVSPKGEGL